MSVSVSMDAQLCAYVRACLRDHWGDNLDESADVLAVGPVTCVPGGHFVHVCMEVFVPSQSTPDRASS